MKFERCEIPEVVLLSPKIFSDTRGFFSEVYTRKALAEIGIAEEFVQDNHSSSVRVGTVRGLHFQRQPFAQAKLVRVTRGRILDVALDLRRTSPTFGRHVMRELSAVDWAQLYIPVGFAHAFCTLEPDTEVVYKVSEYYAPQADAGILWSDPALGLAFPVAPEDAVVSDKDARLPLLEDAGDLF